jgi:hypothetical protein
VLAWGRRREEKTLGRSRLRLEENIEMGLREKG